MHKIAFILFDKFQILDVTGPAQVFSSANDLCKTPAYDISYLSIKGGACRATCGMSVETQKITDLSGFDSLVISGGQGSRQAAEDPKLLRLLQQQEPHAQRLVSICTGAFILSAAGLLEGKRVTTHWAYADRLSRKNPNLTVEPDALFIQQGHITTSAGVTAGMDLALHLVKNDLGKDIAKEISRHMVIFYRRPGGQSQFSAFQMSEDASETAFGQLCRDIIDQPNDDYRISRMAARVNMSERTFIRRFTHDMGLPPAKFVEKSRMDNARHALEQTTLNLDQIAHQSGFQSSEVLRRAFHRHMTISPKEYRQRFGG